ncbi:MAG: CpsD/CapB family tyrosine-protein kinase [Peptostreptococcaceae bacterium]|nr:CpsD/CapB family tyrosine-protein kinase [Peptostreptococcaceae bacterium]
MSRTENKKKINKKERDVISIRQERKRIINEKTDFIITEEYNALRTNILFSLTDVGCKVIGVTSSNPAEGKTTVCLNTAVSIGKTGQKVLLIDGDLRASKQAKLLEIEGNIGLSNLLVNQVKLSEAVKKTKYENLDIIPSGSRPPNPSEMLGSEAMKELMDYLKEYYDYILIDLPPVNIVTDAMVASKYLSGLIIIVRANYTMKEDLIEVIQKINNANAKVIGVVLNANPKGYNKTGKYGNYGNYHNPK